MRVFLDTNVLVSALMTRGLCADLLAAVLAEHELVLGESVLVELSRVLSKKMKAPRGMVAEADAFLRREAVVVSQGSDPGVEIRDPDDAVVLGQAIEGQADVVITGDRDFLDIAADLPIEVLSPRGFWEKLQSIR